MKWSFYIIQLLVFILSPNYGRSNEQTYKDKTVSVWISELSDKSSSEVRAKAQDALRNIGTNALPFLLKEIRVLGEIREKQGITNFYTNPALTKRQMDVHRAFKTLGPIARPAVPLLVNRISDSGLVADFVSSALIQIDPNLAVAVLTKTLTNQNYDIRCVAANRIYEVAEHAETAVPVLIQCLEDKSSDTNDSTNLREFSANALGAIGKPANEIIPVLLYALESDGSVLVRRAAARALSKFTNDAAIIVPSLMRSAQIDAMPLVRSMAIHGLANFGTNIFQAIPELVEGLQRETNSVTRQSFIYTLASLGTNSTPTIPVLRDISKNDPDVRVRYMAEQAIDKIQPNH